MRRLVFAEGAENDLEAIGDHIAADSPNRAVSFIRELRGSCLKLAEMPERYPLIQRHTSSGIRRCVHGHYLIFYRVTDETVIILQILQILHGAMDYEKLLFSED